MKQIELVFTGPKCGPSLSDHTYINILADNIIQEILSFPIRSFDGLSVHNAERETNKSSQCKIPIVITGVWGWPI